MAKLMGHVFPAVYALCLTTWWSYNIFRDFFRNLAYKSLDLKDKKVAGDRVKRFEFRSRVWYPDSLSQRLPLEIAAKLAIPIIHVVTESTGRSPYEMHNMHHTVMAVGFFLDAVIDVMVHRKWPLPEFADTASFIFKLGISIVVFENHQYSKSRLSQELHIYIIGVFKCVALLSALQAAFRSNVTLALLRAYSYQLFATWNIQIGFIVEPPCSVDVFHWKERSEVDQIMLIGFMFACYSLANVVVTMVIGWIVLRATRSRIALEMSSLVMDESLVVDGAIITNTKDDDSDDSIWSYTGQKKKSDSSNGLIISFG